MSFGVSFVAGFTGWLGVLSFTHATPFNRVDPIFGRDLAFYFFQLPFLETLFNAFFGPLFLLTLFTIIFYIVTGVLDSAQESLWQIGAVELGSRSETLSIFDRNTFCIESFRILS